MNAAVRLSPPFSVAGSPRVIGVECSAAGFRRLFDALALARAVRSPLDFGLELGAMQRTRCGE
jgi:hypothetical protein